MLYRSLLRSVLFRLPAETAHELALKSLASAPSFVTSALANRYRRCPFGKLQRFGLTFENPVGLAAGFDKDGIALSALASMGFGFIEAGTVTFHPQPGNPKPRLFRLPLDRALINRAGFNNEGAKAFARRVSKARPDCVLGVSIGKSKIAPLEDAVADYLKTFELVNEVADYIAVNVSSPNTPRLRELQHAEHLDQLLAALQKRNQELSEQHGQNLKPLLLKLSPDLSDEELEDAITVAERRKISGIIATNTTTDRSDLRTDATVVAQYGEGGLSGAPLTSRARTMVAKIYKLTGGTMPIIGVGGIFTAGDAWQMIASGASLVQVYTAFIYDGPSLAAKINDGLRRIISREGFVSLDEAVGSRITAA
ncbi:MAG TPA: quinone-dependent dihydroorotate dehydrogenase [Pyrinomonadaceae bacterium]|nr:quinone-dependent dihydroorotate dehydrogenase [Pyrinomonadaceae bacterium]